eukprot:284817339_5
MPESNHAQSPLQDGVVQSEMVNMFLGHVLNSNWKLSVALSFSFLEENLAGSSSFVNPSMPCLQFRYLASRHLSRRWYGPNLLRAAVSTRFFDIENITAIHHMAVFSEEDTIQKLCDKRRSCKGTSAVCGSVSGTRCYPKGIVASAHSADGALRPGRAANAPAAAIAISELPAIIANKFNTNCRKRYLPGQATYYCRAFRRRNHCCRNCCCQVRCCRFRPRWCGCLCRYRLGCHFSRRRSYSLCITQDGRIESIAILLMTSSPAISCGTYRNFNARCRLVISDKYGCHFRNQTTWFGRRQPLWSNPRKRHKRRTFQYSVWACMSGCRDIWVQTPEPKCRWHSFDTIVCFPHITPTDFLCREPTPRNRNNCRMHLFGSGRENIRHNCTLLHTGRSHEPHRTCRRPCLGSYILQEFLGRPQSWTNTGVRLVESSRRFQVPCIRMWRWFSVPPALLLSFVFCNHGQKNRIKWDKYGESPLHSNKTSLKHVQNDINNCRKRECLHPAYCCFCPSFLPFSISYKKTRVFVWNIKTSFLIFGVQNAAPEGFSHFLTAFSQVLGLLQWRMKSIPLTY